MKQDRGGYALYEPEQCDNNMSGTVLVRALGLQHNIAGGFELELFDSDGGVASNNLS